MMSSYTIRFFDHGHNIYAAKYVDCANDDQAVTAADRLNVASIGAGFEVWQDDRFILQIWNGSSGPVVTVRATRPAPRERHAEQSGAAAVTPERTDLSVIPAKAGIHGAAVENGPPLSRG